MMRKIALTSVAAMLIGAAPPPLPSAILDVTPGQLFEGRVADTAMRYQISADADDRLALNPGSAKRAGLKTGLLGSFAKMLGASSRIGSVKVPASFGKAVQTLDGQPFKGTVMWFDRDVVSAGDGEIGINGVAHQIIAFRLHEPLPAETVHILPMAERRGNVGIIHGEGNRQIFIRFDFSREHALATAAAGARLAQSLGGAFEGDVIQSLVKFGIARPTRTLRMANSLRIGPLVIDRLLVRLVDYGDTTTIPDSLDTGDQILVKGKARGDDDNSFLYIGKHDVAHCSSVTFDKIKREIRMSCRDKL